MDALLARLNQSVSSARTVEELTRPLLELLEATTGMESTYLTTVDVDRGLQHVLYARNTQALQIPEGIDVPWEDTLCKRALDEDLQYTDDVQNHWRGSKGAQMGIQTYTSVPVHTDDGALYGTLCAASASKTSMPDNASDVLGLFAKLIGQSVQREALLTQLQQANSTLHAHASTDALTGLPNRRALMAALERAIAQAMREGKTVLVGFLDLDGFKTINDTHGHETGDEFLTAMARQISGALRGEDILARLGGDEFVLIGPGPAINEATAEAAQAFAQRISQSTVVTLSLRKQTIDYAGASVGVVAIDPRTTGADLALKQADKAMYEVKRARRAAAQR
ncbi:MAG: sensor domain-containing diguanylate cyclase [Rhodoferax sp.]|nr:sensor domain-containing diguanylate cyclase [Rhodoferax sp.]